MATRHRIITRVWIESGCIACDACENDCPEVFDVREEGCVIRPTVGREALAMLTPIIETAAQHCPVDVIKFEVEEVSGAAPWEAEHVDEPASMHAAPVTRRKFNLAIAAGWTAVAAAGVLSLPMFQDFMAPKSSKDAKKQWRIGRLDEFKQPASVYEQFKRTPDGGAGFWIVNLSPRQNRLVAVSVICTHLGCVPDWMAQDGKFKCPCHGSGFSLEGFNLEGPAPRPLERFAIHVDSDGYVVVDQGRVFRQELGQWDDADSFVVV